MTFCFRANGKPKETIPDWLSVEVSFDAREPRFYGIWVVPWIAEPARGLGTLELDGSGFSWIAHLESLGFEELCAGALHRVLQSQS